MKRSFKITTYKKIVQQLVIAGGFILILLPGRSFAQTDSVTKEEPAAAKESSLISPSLDLKSIQKADKSIDLDVSLKAKIKGSFVKLRLLKITFLQVTGDAEKVLGFVITDGTGRAVLNAKADQLQMDKEGKLHFKAVFAGNK